MDNINSLITECKKIEEDCLYTAEVHYMISSKFKKQAFWNQFIPIFITILSIIALLNGYPDWLKWITLLSSIVTMINLLNEPDKKSKEHLFAGKFFTVLKHEARTAHECYKDYSTVEEFLFETKKMRDRYNTLVYFTPMTDNEKAWKKAQERIKSGVHQSNVK